MRSSTLASAAAFTGTTTAALLASLAPLSVTVTLDSPQRSVVVQQDYSYDAAGHPVCPVSHTVRPR
ncbi:hypothetical protein ACL02U_14050 [Streptomyces sp. MS06]|uniref:hypothetical protein n=1 Tax=Streptomyces sp. MS06 TaxID=3385974 RepID=UPI0039A0B2A6